MAQSAAYIVETHSSMEPTIASVMTPLGEGGIGVIAVSGPQAIESVARVFESKSGTLLSEADPSRLYYGHIIDRDTVLDEVLVKTYRPAESLTGLPFVEVNCHGGIVPVQQILRSLAELGVKRVPFEELLSQAVRMGRMDLVQKEARLELPKAKTTLGAAMLVAQMQGALSRELAQIGQELAATETVEEALARCRKLLTTSRYGVPLCRPKRVAIAGAPNVGKSSLFNALLRRDRVIVSPEPGTTRDLVSGVIAIQDVPLELTDTAGLRDPEHDIERLGVEAARRMVDESDAVLVVLDGSRPINPDEDELLTALGGSPFLCAINKTDLPPRLDAESLRPRVSAPVCGVSALRQEGIGALETALLSVCFPDGIGSVDGPVLFTARQAACLRSAVEQLAPREAARLVQKCRLGEDQ